MRSTCWRDAEAAAAAAAARLRHTVASSDSSIGTGKKLLLGAAPRLEE